MGGRREWQGVQGEVFFDYLNVRTETEYVDSLASDCFENPY